MLNSIQKSLQELMDTIDRGDNREVVQKIFDSDPESVFAYLIFSHYVLAVKGIERLLMVYSGVLDAKRGLDRIDEKNIFYTEASSAEERVAYIKSFKFTKRLMHQRGLSVDTIWLEDWLM